ncbi:glycosyl hydrolase 115 family protein [Sphingomonas sp. S-NIH.Pt15_0812]|uniref:glycosyl hydrolase 115 family protein n=1 Tax=Sphingomonas sp. S-NIH.Pt15_0812 TaxID=1920129 RepID=UPI001F4A08D6|nr:glycosyl hydrolase 115 family protein [Sphingomonas sp. S-NIH.Pt15_0812]
MRTRYWLGMAVLGLAGRAMAQDCAAPVNACAAPRAGSLRLIAGARPAAVVVDASADPAVRSAAQGLAGDLARVAGGPAAEVRTTLPASGELVLIGAIGRSPLIDRLVRAGRVSTASVAGRWEAYRQVVVDRPFPGIARALVILGADRRGAVFGTYDLSERIGVSPWAWWADVPVRRQADLSITAGTRVDAPGVRYRGLFINDEEPAFGSWARSHFGGVNAKAYAHVFDLILRLKGNYLWPAMWGKSIAADDPASMALADAKGLVLGTSHHEPMTRAQAEWHRDGDDGVTGGAWDYTTNATNLRAFWRGGIARMMSKGDDRGYEQLVTVGMRGDGDEPMSRDTATGLLERIVTDQRRIIADVTRRPAERTPQLWALYKEVQDYYDAGLKVPGDVTLLFSDDNWGQIRRLPTRDLDRPGGFGVYYHFDYVGGPRSYKWLANTQVEKTWQQMDLAWQSGARAIWIANVGDLKPMEYPIDFFLRMAWNPQAMTPAALAAYPRQWAGRLFGPAQAEAIGALATDYARLAASHKPELVDADSFALGPVGPALDGGAFGAIVAAWQALADRAATVRTRLASDQQDAFAELIGHPVAAMANLYDLYYAVAWNRRLAALDDPRANVFADRAEAAFRRDKALTQAYHRLAGGKWDGMMLQTHFGYTSWNDPKTDIMPRVTRVATTGHPTGSAPVTFTAATTPAPGNYALVEATAMWRSVAAHGLGWRAIPHLGRSRGALVALPQGRPATTPADGIRADYAMTLARPGDATLRLTMVPTLDVRGGAGGRIGVSVDGGPVRTLTMKLVVDAPDWTRAVTDNAFPLEARIGRLAAGPHAVSLWRIDDNMVVQRLLLYTGTLPPGTDQGPAT